jgi:hypothetical protein
MKTLQEQYNLIKEGKGNKDFFMKSTLTQFPNLVNKFTSFNSAIQILSTKGIISEGIGGLVCKPEKEPDWFSIFKENINEEYGHQEAKAEEKKPTKDVVDTEIEGYDYKDLDNIDNIYGEQFLKGFYTEMRDPKNEEKSVEDLKKIVAKNLKKDRLHYVKDGQFGVKGLGYTEDAPGLGIPKEAKGKYKSSGYGTLKENQEKRKLSLQLIDKKDKKGLALYRNTEDQNDLYYYDGKVLYNVRDDGSKGPSVRMSLFNIIGLKENQEQKLTENYMISKSGSKTNPSYVIEKTDGSEQIDMFFDSEEKAKEYADKKGLKISPKKGYNMEESLDEYKSTLGDFDGSGLIVVGSTQLDNNAIGDMLEETDFYGIWNTREGYWFFPEAEETLDILEKELEQEFIQRGISARFEGQYY